MKKLMKVALSSAMLLALAACGAKDEPTVDGKYAIYNSTGIEVEELYVYVNGQDDKGENYAANGLKDGDKVDVTKTVKESEKEDVSLTVEFKTKGGDTQKFETLHIEEAPIQLLDADTAAGATQIKFEEPTK